jgi:hypothetical protein
MNDWFGVHPILALMFMAFGGFVTSLIALVIITVRERIAYNPSRGRHRRSRSA